MLGTIDYVMYIIGLLYLIFWTVLYITGKKNAKLFEGLNEKEYPLKDIYHVGYQFVNLIKYQYKSKKDRQHKKELAILYDQKYADYYLRVVYAQKTTFVLTLMALAVPMYGLADSMAGILIIAMFAWAAYMNYGNMTTTIIEKRSHEMLNEFSNIVSKLALLTNAGMIMREAWEEVANTGNSAIYLEMQKSVIEMKNGVSEVDAITNFGTRCVLPEIKKFASTIVQGIMKGNSELTAMLQEQSKEVWNIKRQVIKRQGEKASSKLMIPIMLMFVGILIMVVVPIFTNLG